MTGKEYLRTKLIEIINSHTCEGFKIKAYWSNFTDAGVIYVNDFTPDTKYITFRASSGVDYKEAEDWSDELRQIMDQIQKDTVILRLLYIKGATIKTLQRIYGFEHTPAPKKAASADIPKTDTYPEEITGKNAIRIKMDCNNTHYGRKVFKTVALGKLIKDKTKFTVTTPSIIGVVHSAELTFLNEEDAEEFIKNNPEVFSEFNRKDIYFVKAQTHTYKRIPVVGTDKAYVNTEYLKWRENTGKLIPKFS